MVINKPKEKKVKKSYQGDSNTEDAKNGKRSSRTNIKTMFINDSPDNYNSNKLSVSQD